MLIVGQCVFQLWLGIIWELLEVTMAWWVRNCICLGFGFPTVPTLKDHCHSHYESMPGRQGWSCEDSVASLLKRGSPALYLPKLSLPPNSSSLSHHQALCKVYIILAQPYGQHHFLFKSLLLIHFFLSVKGKPCLFVPQFGC